ncbi:hypothetical protein HZC00_04015 [Candidatus Kaiserbacteria bacterium]|nr:hypothetical protein [Candidatus Kaiserbacteria bacterium]
MVGDCFDNSNFDLGYLPYSSRQLYRGDRPHRLNKDEKALLKFFKKKEKQGCVVDRITGNHDEPIWRVISMFLERPATEECLTEIMGALCLEIHGDQFDAFYHKHKWTSEIATRAYEKLSYMGPRARWLCSMLKRRAKSYTRALDCVAQGATLHAAHLGARHVFCGHTHHGEHRELNGVHYYNYGCWTQEDCSLVTIGEKGIRIHHYYPDGTPTWIDGPYPI